jgi:hypothetical protein
MVVPVGRRIAKLCRTHAVWVKILNGVAALRAGVDTASVFMIDESLELGLRVNGATREGLVGHGQVRCHKRAWGNLLLSHAKQSARNSCGT